MILTSVSVIIPVYNAYEFLEEAVLSAIHLEVVGEVLLIEDGSKDYSLEKCIELDRRFDKVRVLTHEGGINKGSSASRNLGISEAKFSFIAFLDADDYFLPNRFDLFRKYLEEAQEFDGIYESIQYFNGSDRIYGVKKNISPHKLTYYLIRGTYGHFHTNGLIIKKEILIKARLFIETLDLHEDSDLWIKLSFYGKLISGKEGVPVAMVRRHDGNRIWKGTNNFSRYKQLKVTWNWAKKEKIGLINKSLILRKLILYRMKSIFER